MCCRSYLVNFSLLQFDFRKRKKKVKNERYITLEVVYPEAYSEPSRTSTLEFFFCEITLRVQAVIYFPKKLDRRCLAGGVNKPLARSFKDQYKLDSIMFVFSKIN